MDERPLSSLELELLSRKLDSKYKESFKNHYSESGLSRLDASLDISLYRAFFRASINPQSFELNDLPKKIKDLTLKFYEKQRSDHTASSYNFGNIFNLDYYYVPDSLSAETTSGRFYKQLFSLQSPPQMKYNSQMLYWLQDNLWEKLLKLINEGAFHFYEGSLLSLKSFEDISRYCQDNNILISGIDASNIDILEEDGEDDYNYFSCEVSSQKCIRRDGWDVRLLTPKEGGSQFLNGVSLLPKKKDVFLLFTVPRNKVVKEFPPSKLFEERHNLSSNEFLSYFRLFKRTDLWLYFSVKLDDNFILNASPTDFLMRIGDAVEQASRDTFVRYDDGVFPLIEIFASVPSDAQHLTIKRNNFFIDSK